MSASYRVCRRCSDAFYPARASHYLCRACWKHQAAQRSDARGGHRGAHVERSAARPELDEDVLRAAIALTHPDRHPVERRAEATRITQQLLEARRRAT